jgi:hypothetical protein
MATKAKPQEQAIVLPRLNLQTIKLRLVGDSPLICHAWSEKAKKQMLDKQMKKANVGREAKNPEQDYIDSLYPHPAGGYGFPAVAFKAAAVDAATFVDGITKVQMRGAFHVLGELVKIEGDPSPREDMVKIAMGTSDIRYRGEFKTWAVELTVQFNANAISAEQIVNMFSVAGFGCGVGEWRPQRDGSFGRFHVE